MLPARRFCRYLQPDKPVMHWDIRPYGQVTSTQDIARGIAENESGSAHGVVVTARSQSAGRGRHGRQWDSHTEGNLLASLLIRPAREMQTLTDYSFITALALARTIELYLNPKAHDLQLKWPNDVRINGRKCAGLLLETCQPGNGDARNPFLIIGVGLNVAWAPEEAIALKDVVTGKPDPDILLTSFISTFDEITDLYDKSGFGEILDQWQARSMRTGQPVSVKLPDGQLYGTYEGLCADGALRLRTDDGRVEIIRAGDVMPRAFANGNNDHASGN